MACHSSHVFTSETGGLYGVVFGVSLRAHFHFGLPEGYYSSGWESIRGHGMYIPCAALGTILGLGSTVAPRLAPGPRATPTSTVVLGTGP